MAGNTFKSIAVRMIEAKAIEPIDLYDLVNRLKAGTATLKEVIAGLNDTSGISAKDRQTLLVALTNQDLDFALQGLQEILDTGFIISKRDPLILDLNGDGVKTLGTGAGVHFDHDGNRFAESTGWADKEDGMLVWDKNGNGQIDDGSELFGENSVNKDGKKAANGFSALADLDTNKDGKIDANDAAYKVLRVWKDANGDGKVQAGEMLTLEAAGVKSINTGFKESKFVDSNGNEHRQVGSFTKTDGTTGAMADVWLKANPIDTVEMDTVAVGDRIKALPTLAGFGNVHSLHQAMAQDKSGKLQALIEKFVATKDVVAQRALLNDIIYRWAGVADINQSSRGSAIGDARKLAALEAFLGKEFVQDTGSKNPNALAATQLLKTFDTLSNYIFSLFTLQSPRFASLPDGIKVKVVGDAIQLDVSVAVENLKKSFGADALQGTRDAFEFAQALKALGPAGAEVTKQLSEQGEKMNDAFGVMLANMGAALMVGSAAMTGTSANDYMMGGNGNDTLNGGSGNDVLIGGKGNDVLNGGDGSDTYVFRSGDGKDTVNNYNYSSNSKPGPVDVVKFVDVKSTDVRLRREGSDLIIEYGAGDSVRMQNHYAGNDYRVNQFQFADGVKWTPAQLAAALPVRLTDGNDSMTFGAESSVVYAGKGDDNITGGAGNDILNGEDGNDTLNGGTGNNLLNGGNGNDVLQSGKGSSVFIGGKGNDTIRTGDGLNLIAFNRGDGQDDVVSEYLNTYSVVSLGNGIRYDDLQLKKSGNDLILRTGDQEGVTFKNWYSDRRYQNTYTLQMVTGGSDYDANSADAVRNQKVQNFDFWRVVQKFDQVRSRNPSLGQGWNMRDAMLAFHMNNGDAGATGGELAYQYGTTGSVTNVSVANTQALLASEDFLAQRQKF